MNSFDLGRNSSAFPFVTWIASFAIVLWPLLPQRAIAQVPPEKALATFTVHDPELELSLWASEPLFANPTCIDIDHKGRVWVCESVNYRHKLHHRPPNRPEGDRIVILEDSKGTGKADKATTFYQAPDFLAPLGIAVAKDPIGPGYKVYICHSPDILVFEDKDGDGKADGPPKKLLTGFGGIDHDHGVHGILIGPDGKLYFSVGDQGVHNLQSSDGKGRKWTTNHTDCQGGTIWRCDLDGKNLELLAHNFRNEYEPCVDSFGNIFVSDNDDDGSQQTRICYVMPGGNYGYWPRGPGQTHWHEEQPGVVPKILRTGFGSPTGMCVYEGTLLPKKYWGQLLHTDAGPRQVRCYHLKPKGAGYEVERQDIVTSTDTWFRPSDICVAPDGSVFISDWYDPGVGGHGMGDTTRGRIYRLAPKGNKPSVPKVDLDGEEEFQAALGSPALSVRYMPIAKLRKMQSNQSNYSGISTLCKAAIGESKPGGKVQARALLFLSEWWKRLDLEKVKSNDDLKTLAAGLGLSLIAGLDIASSSEDLRLELLAARISTDLTAFGREPTIGLSKESLGEFIGRALAESPLPSVRREALLSLRNGNPSDVRKPIYKLAKQYDGKDRFYLEAIGIAVGHHDQKRREIILADFEKEFPEWNKKVADLIWELRPPSVMPKLGKRLIDTSLPLEQLLQIVDILSGTQDISGGQSMIQALTADAPAEVRDRILAKLKENLPGKWRDLRRSKELAEGTDRFLEKPETRSLGLALVGVAAKEDSIGRVADIARDSKESLSVRSAAIAALGAMSIPAATKTLEGLLAIEPAELRLRVVQAFGEQLNLYSSDREPAMKALTSVMRANDRDLAMRRTAAQALAGTYHGTEWLLDQGGKKQLSDDIRADVGRLLRNSPFGDLQERALVVFAAPRLDPKKLPSIASLMTRPGDPARGKQILAESQKNDLQCLKCHTIQGVGGNVGPDLSAIGKKASRENLFESILFPSKAIADQYLSWIVETNSGLQITGLLVEETPDHITIRDANAKDTKIAKKDIASREKSSVSIMPADLLAYMTEDDLVDMVEYLFTLKEEK
jgi:putative membrane-bound dehydrogenase-like protein